jgi:DNA modification methylase
MEIVERNIQELIEAEYNPRQITDKQFAQLKDSLKRFGFVDPVLVNMHPDRENIIIGGHMRTKAAKDLGYTEVPCVELNLTYDQEKELNIRLNKNGGSFDMDALANYFEASDLIEYGFEPYELGDVVTEIEPAEEGEVNLDPPKEPITVLGDLYELNGHRLHCADSTDSDAVAKLMDGKKADMVFTDPPYNIGYRDMNQEFDAIKNDRMSDEDFKQFLYDALNIQSDTFYVCCSWQYSHLFRQAMEELDKPVKSFIVWNKVNPAQNLDKYYKQHEIILYHGKFGGQETLRGDIWEVKRQHNTLHPTMKPIELITIALNDNPDKKNVYDAFGGSGSTMIASEQCCKDSFLLELEPNYCDVIVRRWVKYMQDNSRPYTVKRNGELLTAEQIAEFGI